MRKLQDIQVIVHYPTTYFGMISFMKRIVYADPDLLYEKIKKSKHKFFQDVITQMNQSEELKLRRENEKPFRAINVGCMMPYMNYEPRTLKELLNDSTATE